MGIDSFMGFNPVDLKDPTESSISAVKKINIDGENRFHSVSLLPWPTKAAQIHDLIKDIDDNLLNCSEEFIRLQVRRPLDNMIKAKTKYALDSPQSTWFNIYSIFNANQQINEACNKLWATVELTNATSTNVFNRHYAPAGKKFHGSFILGTTLPTLYYAQLSAVVSALSSFGCIPVMVNQKRYYLLRSQDGWSVQPRNEYRYCILCSSFVKHTIPDYKSRSIIKVSYEPFASPTVIFNLVPVCMPQTHTMVSFVFDPLSFQLLASIV